MPIYEIAVQVKKNGEPVSGFPVTRRIETDESQSFEHEEVTGGGFVALPTSEMDELNLFLARVDQEVTFRFDGQTDAGIVLKSGGLILIIDADIDDGAATNATVSNVSGKTVNIKGLAGGT